MKKWKVGTAESIAKNAEKRCMCVRDLLAAKNNSTHIFSAFFLQLWIIKLGITI